MDPFDPIRRAAVDLHDLTVAAGGDPKDPLGFVTTALDKVKNVDLELVWFEPGNPGLKDARARLDDQAGFICCENVGTPASRALLVAHELGHAKLHIGSLNCSHADVDASQTIEAAPVGLQRVEDYGVKERQELQANVFGREFLLPRKLAREMFVESSLSADAICELTGLPLPVVRQQLLDALLLPEAQSGEMFDSGAYVPKPDASQDRAVDYRGSPYLLQAGPGTGKTRTLVKRIVSLVNDGVDPASILVLTFSNRAAGELSERLATAIPDSASKVWVGTFHAFGLELVRKHYCSLKLPEKPTLFDRSDAIEVLEEILPILPLEHYRNLWDPTLILRELLDAISRAKDELVGPMRYRELAEAMLAEAGSDDDKIEAAEKCLEVAEVYDIYERVVADKGAIDFGDLIMRPTQLLEANKAVLTRVQLQYRHILVDEYQDVNRASARMVKLIAADAKRLWVVGDARQSIYRFRGASSANMTKFKTDYPEATVDRLDINYRSSQQVVDNFVAAASKMSASQGMLPLTLSANNGVGPASAEIRRFETLDEEIAGVAASVSHLQTSGVAFRDQVVLCRTNKRLNEIASGLEARGIPVLHFGSLFERDEIRDLLALLSLTIDPFGDAVVRVGAMPRYGLSLQDVYEVSKTIRSQESSFLDGLVALRSNKVFSVAGQRGLGQLSQDLREFDKRTTAWEFMATYLLDRTDIARDLAQSDTVSGQMKGVAIWQLMNFLRDQPPTNDAPPIEKTLSRIRQIVLLAEDRDLRQVPGAALHMDAVRLMTVHGSKGLEFDAVHLPGMTVSSFPSNNRGQRCPSPHGMIEGSAVLSAKEFTKQAHATEEECLYFVAISRAKKHLNLYLAKKQPSGSNRKASPFLDWMPRALATEISMPDMMSLPAGALESRKIDVSMPDDWLLTDGRITSFERCPRRFFYTHVLGLGSARKMTSFSRTHDCIYGLMRWLRKERISGNPTLQDMQAKFAMIWAERGPVGLAFEADYMRLADCFVRNLQKAGEGREFLANKKLPIKFGNGSVYVEPSEIACLEDGRISVRRVRTGYCRSDEYSKLEYALYLLAAETEFGPNVRVEALHLTDNQCEDVPMTPRVRANREKTCGTLVGQIASGQFPPDVDAVSCPRCPHFFICASAPDGDLKIS